MTRTQKTLANNAVRLFARADAITIDETITAYAQNRGKDSWAYAWALQTHLESRQ